MKLTLRWWDSAAKHWNEVDVNVPRNIKGIIPISEYASTIIAAKWAKAIGAKDKAESVRKYKWQQQMLIEDKLREKLADREAERER